MSELTGPAAATSGNRLAELIDSLFGHYARAAVVDSEPEHVTDRLYQKLLLVVAPLPPDVLSPHSQQLMDRIEAQKSQPALGYHVMLKNLTLLNSRMLPIFVVLDLQAKFASWSNPYMTIGVSLVVTLVILNPVLLTVIPLVLVVMVGLVPHYLHVYKPDDTAVAHGWVETNPIPAKNPLDKYHIPTPVPQFSREFLVNMTDLQNHQLDFVRAWDFVVWLTRDYLYYKNEDTSALVFVGLLFMAAANLYFIPVAVRLAWTHFVAVKVSMVVFYWVFIVAIYPSNKAKLMAWLCDEETRLRFQSRTNRVEQTLGQLLDRTPVMTPSDPDYDARQVEVFELQRFDRTKRAWHPMGYGPNFYTLNSTIRKYHEASHIHPPEQLRWQDVARMEEEKRQAKKKRPEGAPEPEWEHIGCLMTLEAIVAPENWTFIEPKWDLDLNAHTWVNEYFVNDLVMIDDGEKWAYDVETPGTDIFRRRRWVRNVRRRTWKDKMEELEAEKWDLKVVTNPTKSVTG